MLSDQDINAIADKIVKLNLSAACVFLLEAHLPLCGIVHNFSLLGAPLLSGFRGYENFSEFFSDCSNVERLIDRLT